MLIILDPTGIMPIKFHNKNFNSIQIKEKNLNEKHKKYNGLILGTSSLMTFDLDYLKQKSDFDFFNYALFNSIPSYSLMAYRHFRDEIGKPEIILIGVDFFAFNDNNIPFEDILKTKILHKYSSEKVPFLSRVSSNFNELLSKKTFTQSINIIEGILKNKKPRRSISKNGTLIYNAAEEEIESGKYDFTWHIKRTSKTDSDYYNKFIKFDKNLKELKILTKEINADKVRFLIILPPIHQTYNNNLAEISIYNSFYEQINNLYKEKVIDLRTIVGSENDSNYFDARHVRSIYTRKLIDKFSDAILIK